jgi:hypothetical protein
MRNRDRDAKRIESRAGQLWVQAVRKPILIWS